MRVIAFIPVRGGSKSIPHKNIKSFLGKPLVYWVVKAASEVQEIDKVVVATDSDEICNTVAAFDLPKVILYDRDPANAQDTSSTESVMLEYISKANLPDEDVFILLQATSPLTRAQDIEEALRYYRASGKDSLLSCVSSKRFFWSSEGWPLNYDYKARPRRQDFSGLLMENGAIYINTIKNIKQHQNRLSGSIAVYIMPDCTAHELDAPLDWDILEMIADKGTVSQLRHKGIKLFATDLDGVLTDGGMYYSESGDELKRFNTRDAVGLRLLSEAGIITAVITSEECELNRRRAEKMQVDYLFQRIQDKVLCVRELCQQLKISMEQVAYIGDDLNDMSLLKVVGCGACPADAVESVKNLRGLHILNSLGGKGAVREFAEMVLK